MNNLICDRDGVPLLIQRIVYVNSSMHFRVYFFNGYTVNFTTDRICPSVGLMQAEPDNMQMLEARNNIKKLASENWKEWFRRAEYLPMRRAV